MIEVAIPWVLLARAETKLTSSLTGLLIAAVPLVGAVVVTLTGDRERQGSRRWLGLLVGLVGVAALVGLDLGSVDALAVVEVGAGRRLLRDRADHPLAPRSPTCRRSASSRPRSCSRRSSTRRSPRRGGRRLCLPAACLPRWSGSRVICTAIAFLVFFALIGEVGPVRATVITYVNPVGRGRPRRRACSASTSTAGMGVGFVLVLDRLRARHGPRAEVVAES